MENPIPYKASLQRGELTAPQPSQHWSDLPWLADQRNLRAILRLLKRGECPNAQDHYGRTALHLAILRDEVEIVRVLLQHGASVHIEDRKGRSPWDIALSCSPDDMILKMLLEGFLSPSDRKEWVELGLSKIFPS
ncbi:MAG: ankyrin repeat domain-containing protein [Planctomycetes bacterium]|nr:ankyrin repeat domain-containing protein [Planctomycetota bacterium]